MSDPAGPLSHSARPSREQGIQHIKRRQWSLWSSAVLVILLLTAGIASFAFPGLLEESRSDYAFNQNLALRGLIGMVLIFTVHIIYQQLQIQRMQANFHKQVQTLDQIEERTEEVYKMAVLDPLTGLYNRRFGDRRLSEEILHSRRSGYPLTVFMADLNDLKAVNDTYGHAAGDQMIVEFARYLQKSSRGSDVAIRFGGDEFLVVLPECKPNDVPAILQRLEARKFIFNGHTIGLSFAAGWTDYIPGESIEALIQRADSSLYTNKRICQS